MNSLRVGGELPGPESVGDLPYGPHDEWNRNTRIPDLLFLPQSSQPRSLSHSTQTQQFPGARSQPRGDPSPRGLSQGRLTTLQGQG